jgi:flagellar assembly factor FliW
MVGSSPTLLFSAFFGTLNLDQAAILSFPQGLPGFETELRFAAIQIPGQQPLLYLQSVATADLCLLVFPVQAIAPNFHLHVSSDDSEMLNLAPDQLWPDSPDLLALAIVAVDAESGATANLAAPLVVNLRNSRAVQVLQQEPALSYRHPLSFTPPAC